MATLNLNEKKIPSAENLRLLSSLILSLSSKQGAIENKLINNWVASTAYIKDESFVIYDELLYVCKISNADDTFDKNKWTCLSPTISELTKTDIEALINLSPEEISKLSDLISTEIRLDKTFSSSDTYTRIQAAIDTAKEYTNNQLGKAVKPAYKVVSNTSEVTETGYFYLISNGTNYDMYVLSADGSVVSLGTSDVDLSNYYTKTEVDNDFLKKLDATSTYATITTVDGKVDKTSIATTLDNTVTDDEVTSALLAKTELDKRMTYRGNLDDRSILDVEDGIWIVNKSNTSMPTLDNVGVAYKNTFSTTSGQEFKSIIFDGINQLYIFNSKGKWVEIVQPSNLGGVVNIQKSEHSNGYGQTNGVTMTTLAKGHKYIIVCHFQSSKSIADAVNMNGSLVVGGVTKTVRYMAHNGGGADSTFLVDATDGDKTVTCGSYNSVNMEMDFIYDLQVMTLV